MTTMQTITQNAFFEIMGGSGGSRLSRHNWREVYAWIFRRYGWADAKVAP